MKSKLYFQIYKFAVVGIFNTAIDLAVLNLLIFTSGRGETGAYFSIYKGVSFVVSSINSYYMNKYWTFKGGKEKQAHVELIQFFVISVGGFIFNVVVATFVVNYISAPHAFVKLWPTLAALCGTGIGLIWNYIGYKFIVFKEHKELVPPA